MPSLHELFDAATDGMPPLPDLAPSARRIVRRRQLATRTSAAVLSSALVIGAGTFALSVQHSGNARDAASGPPHAYNQQYVLDTLRNLWPNKNQQLSAMPGGIGIVVTQAGKEAAFAYFSVFADASKFPSELSCLSQQDCLKATTDDGDNVLAEHGQFSPAAATASASHTLSQTLPPTTPATTPTNSNSQSKPIDQVSGASRGYRLHGAYFGQLSIAGLTGAQLMTDQQLLEIMESPAYEQLIESAVAASSVNFFGTPPPDVPSGIASVGPSPSTSGTFEPPLSASGTLAPSPSTSGSGIPSTTPPSATPSGSRP